MTDVNEKIVEAVRHFLQSEVPLGAAPRAICIAVLLDAGREENGRMPMEWQVGLSLIGVGPEQERALREYLAAQLFVPPDEERVH